MLKTWFFFLQYFQSTLGQKNYDKYTEINRRTARICTAELKLVKYVCLKSCQMMQYYWTFYHLNKFINLLQLFFEKKYMMQHYTFANPMAKKYMANLQKFPPLWFKYICQLPEIHSILKPITYEFLYLLIHIPASGRSRKFVWGDSLLNIGDWRTRGMNLLPCPDSIMQPLRKLNFGSHAFLYSRKREIIPIQGNILLMVCC